MAVRPTDVCFETRDWPLPVLRKWPVASPARSAESGQSHANPIHSRILSAPMTRRDEDPRNRPFRGAADRRGSYRTDRGFPGDTRGRPADPRDPPRPPPQDPATDADPEDLEDST